MKTSAGAVHTAEVSLLGLRVHTLSDSDVVTLVTSAIRQGAHYVLGHHNSHSAYLWDRDPQMREFHARADYVLIDGMSLILLGRVAGLPLKREHRATSLDFMPLLLPEVQREGWRIYYLGSRSGVAEKGAAVLREQYPGLQIRTHHGYFSPARSSEENRAVLNDIKDYEPHILLVGMGMPRQERWILENRAELTANVIAPCGAHMDYVAGEIPTAPRWLALIYLEWLYRLLAEPKRLAYRYLVEPWSMMQLLFRGKGVQEPGSSED
jgi:N-acetylglucosaminyldiphosphoundecaprenol N-acetyl-beta-D-mannosaminyltransferase